MSGQRVWYPPEHRAWVFLGCDSRPKTPDEVASIAEDFGCETDEVTAIRSIAVGRDIRTHPFVLIAEDGHTPPSFNVEVIALAGTVEFDVYERYNS